MRSMRIGKGTKVRWKKGAEYTSGKIELAYEKANKTKDNNSEKSTKAFLIKQDDGGLVLKLDSEIEFL